MGRLALGAFLVAGLSGAAGAATSPAGAAVGATANTGAPCTASWTMYQHDANHTGGGCSTLSTVSAATMLPAWFAATPGAVTAEPTVASGMVYAGDSSGLFHAVDQATGATRWTFSMNTPLPCFRDQPNPSADQHKGGFGSITSSANVSSDVGANPAHPGDPTLYFGGGGSLYAIDALTGACDWAQDLDPGKPTSSIEVESSPVVDTSVSPPEVIVGNDDNSSSGIQVTGTFAFNALTGALLWRYEPERDVTLYPSQFGGSDATTLSCGDGTANANCNPVNVPGLGQNSTTWADACGDVWASPALDPTYLDPAGTNTYQSAQPQATKDPVWQPKTITANGLANSASAPDGLVLFGTGNCGANPAPSTTYAHDDYAHTEGEFALDPVTGVRVWNWFAPFNLYNTGNPNEQGSGDDDFGSSPILTTVPNGDFPANGDPCPGAGGSTPLVIQGSKAGFAYAICESNGGEVWGVQGAQAGQLGPSTVGALGGYIGSPSIGVTLGRPTAYFDAAIFLPFADNGVRLPGSGDDAGATCPGLIGPIPLLPACPDPSLIKHPERLLSVQAIDAATGAIVWRAAAAPSYAATTYSNGVVFAASTTTFTDDAYDANTGLPLWRFPLAAAVASGTAVVGGSAYVGSGLSEGQAGSTTVPPGRNGIWRFDPNALVSNGTGTGTGTGTSTGTTPGTSIGITTLVCGTESAASCSAGGAGPWTSSVFLASGNTAYWKITVTNTGQTALGGVTISDPVVPACGNPSAPMSLAVGQSASIYCSSADVTSTFTNVASADYSGRIGTAPTSSAQVNVVTTQSEASANTAVVAAAAPAVTG